MPYPENFNTARFAATIGSRATDAEIARKNAEARVLSVIEEAFVTYPEDGFLECCYRWQAIETAILKAIPDPDAREMDLAKEACFDGDKEAMLQNVRDILKGA